MGKVKYTTPTIMMAELEATELLAASDVYDANNGGAPSTNSRIGINDYDTYGGNDTGSDF